MHVSWFTPATIYVSSSGPKPLLTAAKRLLFSDLVDGITLKGLD
jgi:hypothetical protein